MKRIAINGFGRIGRLTFRNLMERANVEIVAINDLTDTATLAHLLKYDSAHGGFPGTVSHGPDSLIVNGKSIRVTAIKNPAELPCGEIGVDLVVESTGIFTSKEQLELHRDCALAPAAPVCRGLLEPAVKMRGEERREAAVLGLAAHGRHRHQPDALDPARLQDVELAPPGVG